MKVTWLAALFASCWCSSLAQKRISGFSDQYKSENTLGEYTFGYNEDHSSGGSFRRETSDRFGNKIGSYGLRVGDGRVRIVNYVADQNGFRADVVSNEPGMVSQDSNNFSKVTKKSIYSVLVPGFKYSSEAPHVSFEGGQEDNSPLNIVDDEVGHQDGASDSNWEEDFNDVYLSHDVGDGNVYSRQNEGHVNVHSNEDESHANVYSDQDEGHGNVYSNQDEDNGNIYENEDRHFRNTNTDGSYGGVFPAGGVDISSNVYTDDVYDDELADDEYRRASVTTSQNQTISHQMRKETYDVQAASQVPSKQVASIVSVEEVKKTPMISLLRDGEENNHNSDKRTTSENLHSYESKTISIESLEHAVSQGHNNITSHHKDDDKNENTTHSTTAMT